MGTGTTTEAIAVAPAVPWTEGATALSTRDMTRAQWLEARRAGIGSSDGAAVLGLDPWSSPLQVYLDKRGLLPEREQSPAMRWGTALEPLVAEWFEEETGRKVRRRLAILRHPERAHVIADLDRLVVGEGVPLEIKTTSAWSRDEWEDGDIPLRVVVQLQHQLAVTGAAYGYWAVLIGGNDARWGRLERDDALIAQMLDRYAAFWSQHVESGVEPTPSAASDAETVGLLHPTEEAGKTVLLSTADRTTLEDYLRAKGAAKAAQEALKTAAARVQALIGDAEAALLPGVEEPVAVWKTRQRNSYTVAATAYRQLDVKERVLIGR